MGDVLRSELVRQLRLSGQVQLNAREIDALVQAVRLALTRPTQAMLKAGWGHHLNVETQLGREYATDDYERVMTAFFESLAAPKQPKETPSASAGRPGPLRERKAHGP
ncbi:hypothetical protein ABEG18_06235 [Alsobacter sp. KACC 23698]|uniref:Uncharacterized protein n=1 Tax=Alsobacter sp. KACC 23698 TaxID=3149229 RepID=A0AAU7JJJ8_9HYPH